MDYIAPFFLTIFEWIKLVLLYVQRREKKVVFRRWWVKHHILESVREVYGAYTTLFIYFAENYEEEFYKMAFMTPD